MKEILYFQNIIMFGRVTPLHCRLNSDYTLKYLWKLPIQKFTFKLPNVGLPQPLKLMTKLDIPCLMMAVQHKIKLYHCWNPRTQTKLDGKLKCSDSLTRRKCSIFTFSLFALILSGPFSILWEYN